MHVKVYCTCLYCISEYLRNYRNLDFYRIIVTKERDQILEVRMFKEKVCLISIIQDTLLKSMLSRTPWRTSRNSILTRTPSINIILSRTPCGNRILSRTPCRNSISSRAASRNSILTRTPCRNSILSRKPYRNSILYRTPCKNSILSRTPCRIEYYLGHPV